MYLNGFKEQYYQYPHLSNIIRHREVEPLTYTYFTHYRYTGDCSRTNSSSKGTEQYKIGFYMPFVICPLITDLLDTLYQGFIDLNQQGFICNRVVCNVLLSLSLFKYTFSAHSTPLSVFSSLSYLKTILPLSHNPCPLNTNDTRFHKHTLMPL